MNEIKPFDFDGQPVRVVDVDGEPWFVASDVAKILGYRDASDLTRRVEPEDKGPHIVRTPGGAQQVIVVSEPGLYVAIIRSQSEAAKPFRRWLTHDVLPAIRKTGQYGAPATLTGPELMAAALIEAHKVIEDRDAKVAALAPRAQAWDVMVSAAGDYAVDEAAKILSRDPDIEIGRNRLFSLLSELGWIYRQGSRNRWHAYQTAVQTGRLVERMSSAFLNARTGQMEAPAPTIRITPKGLDDLRARILPRRLEVVAG